MDQKTLHDFVEEHHPNICQIVAYKDGKEVYADEWHQYRRDDCTHVMSVTKSIVSLLVGIALDQGLIKSINDKVLDYFPDYKVKRGEKTIYEVTLRHLLTMTAPYKYKSEPWSKVCRSDDWTIAALDLLGGKKGITGEFKYSTLGVHILTGLISRQSGMKIVDFANRYLFEPLGIREHRNYLVQTAEEHKHFKLCKEPKENVWFCDPQGIGTAGYGLCFSAKDLGKIGEMCLNKGSYAGKQIVASKWIEEMRTPFVMAGERFRDMSYGYLWWSLDSEKEVYAAIGDGGNVIYVDSKNHIVVAITAYFKPAVYDRIDFIEAVIKQFILSRNFCTEKERQ
ncbi:MAG: serine hydrolase [Eubacterium sp.]|nr:serine hydrolase [Eubacterium sp.]